MLFETSTRLMYSQIPLYIVAASIGLCNLSNFLEKFLPLPKPQPRRHPMVRSNTIQPMENPIEFTAKVFWIQETTFICMKVCTIKIQKVFRPRNLRPFAIYLLYLSQYNRSPYFVYLTTKILQQTCVFLISLITRLFNSSSTLK